MRLSRSVVSVVCLGFLVSACGSKPVREGATVGNAGAANSAGNGSASGSGGDSVGSSGEGQGGNTPGFIPTVNIGGGPTDLIVTEDPEGKECRTVEQCTDKECGPVADDCGGIVECGGCGGDEICGGGGPSLCGLPGSTEQCTPTTCESLGKQCGEWPDTCGGSIDCAGCDSADKSCSNGLCVLPEACESLRTCDFYAGETGLCGPVSDGCSGFLDCSFECTGDDICGAQQQGKCGPAACVPSTNCTAALAGKPSGYCGVVSDNCGGVVAGCAAECTDGDTCGGGPGNEEVCGQGGSTVCEPLEPVAACSGLECGTGSDTCGGSFNCGTCGTGEFCEAGQCKSTACVTQTCQSLGADCGQISPGCGEDPITCEDTCPGQGMVCGAGTANQNTCGTEPVCEPIETAVACAAQGINCGPAQNGCNGLTEDCGICDTAAGEVCGFNNQAGVCGAPQACLPLTCDAVGSTCGATPDGCGSDFIIGGCGSCLDGFECISNGGGGGTCEEIEIPCTGLCESQDTTCDPAAQTRITGTVYAPNGTEPLFNALVYIPNLTDISELPAIETGPDCVSCEEEDLGNPLVAAVTGPDGTFALENVPAGIPFPLVVKMGKWRRVVMIPAVDGCSSTPLAVDDMRLPRFMTDAPAGMQDYVNIPKMAMATGRVDAIECVLRKIGLDDSEFSDPSGDGRVHLYRGYRGVGTGCSEPVRADGRCRSSNGVERTLIYTDVDQLFENDRLNDYDVALFDCEGDSVNHSDHEENLHDWADAGGRVFASHYSYRYLDSNGDFESTATWDGSNEFTEARVNNPTTGILDVSHEKGTAFNQWLGLVDAHHPTRGSGFIEITDPRGYVRTVDPALTTHFVSTDENQTFNEDTAVQQFSFNTPVGTPAATACGRVLYSAFHVANTPNNQDERVFPDHCNDDPLTAQEKVLEFMIFDLSACVSTTAPPTCLPSTCEDLGATCGAISDGCGGGLQCGTCDGVDEFCGGGGKSHCGNGCTLTSCAAQGAECGIVPDGCGGQLPSCGDCTGDATCGGGGQANICGTPLCSPRTCADASAECGSLADGCGGSLDCGTCDVQGESCLGNQCGSGSCTVKTCEEVIAAGVGQQRCGQVGDGCDGVLECGDCPLSSTCGAGGPSLCGPICNPLTCDDQRANCGTVGDGCGGAITCGTCGEGAQCGAGNICTTTGCSVLNTCASEGAECGVIADGCGGTQTCGSCDAGEVCGAGNQCGASTCTPQTVCRAEDCGVVSNGCSGVLDCGPCDCSPQTCEQQGANCGPVPDGCGDLISGGCGICTNGNTCGGGGTPSVCGGAVQ